MAFIDLEPSAGIPGKIYVPDCELNAEVCGKKKHPCPDCFDCQFCSDERCALCLKRKECQACKD